MRTRLMRTDGVVPGRAADDGAPAHGLDCGAVLAVYIHPRWRDPGAAAIVFVAACALAGCFKDEGPGQLTSTPPVSTTSTPTSTTTTTGGDTQPTTTGSSSSEGTTAALPDPKIAFRLSNLTFIDPHFFLVDGGGGGEGTTGTTGMTTGEPADCSDSTLLLNTFINQDITDGDFNLVIVFDALEAGAEMRLFEGECEDPGDGSLWTCSRRDGATQTIFQTQQVDQPPCRQVDPAFFQAANFPALSDPQPPCLRTDQVDLSIPVSNAAGALNLRDAQMVASADDMLNPQFIPVGLLYGFLTKTSAEDIIVDVPLFNIPNLWSVIDVPQCAAEFPEQVPAIESLEIGGMPQPGVWLGINFTAERVLYAP
jgi:hypothetical protein